MGAGESQVMLSTLLLRELSSSVPEICSMFSCSRLCYYILWCFWSHFCGLSLHLLSVMKIVAAESLEAATLRLTEDGLVIEDVGNGKFCDLCLVQSIHRMPHTTFQANKYAMHHCS